MRRVPTIREQLGLRGQPPVDGYGPTSTLSEADLFRAYGLDLDGDG